MKTLKGPGIFLAQFIGDAAMAVLAVPVHLLTRAR